MNLLDISKSIAEHDRLRRNEILKKMFSLESVSNLPKLFNKLISEGSDNNFFILYFNIDRNLFIQFASKKDSDTILCLGVSNAYLEEKNHLTESQIKNIIHHGWEILTDDFSKHFKREYLISESGDYKNLIKIIEQTAKNGYGCSLGPDNQISLNIE